MWFNVLWTKMLVLRNRLQAYIGLINTLMLLKLFWSSFEDKTISIALLVVCGIVTTIVVFYDYKFIFGRENEITWERNSSFVNMRNQITKIKEQLDRIEGAKK